MCEPLPDTTEFLCAHIRAFVFIRSDGIGGDDAAN